MLAKIAKWVLRLVEVEVDLMDDNLHIVLRIGNVIVLDKSIELKPHENISGLKRGKTYA
jgi:hypothetical protein